MSRRTITITVASAQTPLQSACASLVAGNTTAATARFPMPTMWDLAPANSQGAWSYQTRAFYSPARKKIWTDIDSTAAAHSRFYEYDEASDAWSLAYAGDPFYALIDTDANGHNWDRFCVSHPDAGEKILYRSWGTGQGTITNGSTWGVKELDPVARTWSAAHLIGPGSGLQENAQPNGFTVHPNLYGDGVPWFVFATNTRIRACSSVTPGAAGHVELATRTNTGDNLVGLYVPGQAACIVGGGSDRSNAHQLHVVDRFAGNVRVRAIAPFDFDAQYTAAGLGAYVAARNCGAISCNIDTPANATNGKLSAKVVLHPNQSDVLLITNEVAWEGWPSNVRPHYWRLNWTTLEWDHVGEHPIQHSFANGEVPTVWSGIACGGHFATLPSYGCLMYFSSDISTRDAERANCHALLWKVP